MRVGGQPIRAGSRNFDRQLVGSVQRHPKRAATIDGGPGLARRVLDVQGRLAVGRRPTAPIAIRRETPPRSARRRARRGRRWAAAATGAPEGRRRPPAPPGSRSRFPGTRPPRSAPTGARRPCPTKRVTASPCIRRRAMPRSPSRPRPGCRARAGRAPPGAFGIGGEREPGRVDADQGQAGVPVPLIPGLQVRQRADAGHVRDVHEVDEERAAGADPLDRRRGSAPTHATSGGNGGTAMFSAFGLIRPGIVMPFAA